MRILSALLIAAFSTVYAVSTYAHDGCASKAKAAKSEASCCATKAAAANTHAAAHKGDGCCHTAESREAANAAADKCHSEDEHECCHSAKASDSDESSQDGSPQ